MTEHKHIEHAKANVENVKSKIGGKIETETQKLETGQYTIVQRVDMANLIKEGNRLMEHGWKPTGGVMITSFFGFLSQFSQAFYRENK